MDILMNLKMETTEKAKIRALLDKTLNLTTYRRGKLTAARRSF